MFPFPLYSVIRIKNPFKEADYILVHELAHAYHREQRSDLTEFWTRKFTDPLRSCNSEDLELFIKEGIVDSYAAFNCVDQSYDLPESSYRQPLTMCHPDNNFLASCDMSYYRSKDQVVSESDVMDELYRRINKFPANLIKNLPAIIIDKKLLDFGDFMSKVKIREEYYLCNEDVAVHTERFYSAQKNPAENFFVVMMLSTNQKTNDRLETLIEFGFLEPDYRRRLADRIYQSRNRILSSSGAKYLSCDLENVAKAIDNGKLIGKSLPISFLQEYLLEVKEREDKIFDFEKFE